MEALRAELATDVRESAMAKDVLDEFIHHPRPKGFARYNLTASASVDVTCGPTFVKWESAFPLWLSVVARERTRGWNNRKPV